MFTVAWRNIWRNKLRTLLTMGGIGFSTFLFVFFVPLQMGTYDTMIELSLKQYHGHAQVQVEGYKDKPQFHKYIEEGEVLTKAMRQSGNYQAVAARSYAFALVQANERAYGAQIVGVEPEHEPEVSSIPGNLKQGSYLSHSDASEAVIGAALARNLNANIGDELLILGMGENGTTAAVIVNVVGIFESNSQELDRSLVQIPLNLFQDVFEIRDAVHVITIIGEGLEYQQQTLKQMRQDIQGHRDLVVLGWEQLIPDLKQGIELDRASGLIFMMILVVVVVFSIFNTFLMSVMERTREFGLMLALGARPKNIVLMVMLESMLMILIGVGVGFLLGYGLNLNLLDSGFVYPGMEEVSAQFNIPLGRIYPDMSWFHLLLGPVVVIITTNVASWIPLLKIHRIKPVEAMRTV